MSSPLENGLRLLLAAALCFNAGNSGFARDTLFRKASRNYDEQGELGMVYRRELERRMFTHATWVVRLYCSRDEPDIDETIEVYTNADGSRWLEHRRATPSLSRFIRERVAHGEKFDLEKKLEGVRIARRQVALPAAVANGIEQLWRAMLSKIPGEPKESTTHTLYLNAPVFIAFAREDNAVTTGAVATAGYESPAYQAFAGIVDDLITLCDGNASARGRIFAQLPGKMRELELRLAIVKK